VALATHGLQSAQPFNAVFRYFLILVFASLFTMLARAAARLREDLALSGDRNRMAMEMHDGVQSHLMSLTKQLELIEHVASTSPERTASLAAEGRESSRLAADELRYLVTRMRSPMLAAGFLPALRNFTESFATRHELSLEFEVVGNDAQTDLDTQHAAFRIVQEALTNVVRHAAATEVKIIVEYKPKWISISITDNGHGFDPTTESEGLDGMRRRAREVGGSLSITSTPKQETRIEATLPLEKTTE
jgi:signal transduction histidine kinase